MIGRVLFILALLTACAPPGTQRLSLGQSVDIGSAGMQLSFIRSQNGLLRPLGHNPQLQAAAQAHADDLLQSGQFSHTGSDGSSAADRVGATSYTACVSAENIAQGPTDVRGAIAQWMESPAHRDNILNAQVTQFGFGQASDIWVLVLARPC
ncbi:MAG: CAP domain-containing protein [Octadecabacter sp.]|nr:CAP domain-containing protein [Octadecabacter sp.]